MIFAMMVLAIVVGRDYPTEGILFRANWKRYCPVFWSSLLKLQAADERMPVFMLYIR